MINRRGEGWGREDWRGERSMTDRDDVDRERQWEPGSGYGEVDRARYGSYARGLHDDRGTSWGRDDEMRYGQGNEDWRYREGENRSGYAQRWTQNFAPRYETDFDVRFGRPAGRDDGMHFGHQSWGGPDYGSRFDAQFQPGPGNVGVPSHRGKGPKGFKRSDERLRERVCEALADHHEIDASDVEVQVKDGEVMLNGTVDDRYQKRLAEYVAESIGGIVEVQNQLRLRRQQPEAQPQNGSKMQGTQPQPQRAH